MSAAKHDHESPKSYRLPTDGGWASAWRITAVLAVLGIGASFFGWSSDPHRFAFSWLFAFLTFLAMALGATFFVIFQHMSGASWSVSLRRIPELLMAGLPVFALLFIPVWTGRTELYPWVPVAREVAAERAEHAEHASSESLVGASIAQAQDHGHAEHGHGEHAAPAHGGGHVSGHDAHHTPQHAAHENVIREKVSYLNEGFFFARAIFYFLVWIFLSMFFLRGSTTQDTTRDLSITKRMQSASPAATFLLGITLTFAAFDWMMSLEPSWFSTIFGVQYFAVSMVSSLAISVLILYGLYNANALRGAISTEHFHDIGKLLFGFLVFWAYITFSQFMLIWYASIPEETTYYHLRWTAGWKTFSLAMVFIHFAIPFFLLISRNVKRRLAILAFGAAWILVAHVLELFWLVMPYATPGGLAVHWMDVAALFAVGGAYLTVVFVLMGRFSLVPVGDPRIGRALHHEVT